MKRGYISLDPGKIKIEVDGYWIRVNSNWFYRNWISFSGYWMD